MGFHLTRPGDPTLRSVLEGLTDAAPTYTDVGATRDPGELLRGGLPRRHRLHHGRIRLGSGEACFARARAALESWTMFRVPAAQLCWPEVKPESGAVVGVLAHNLGVWSFHPCRVVYVDHETGPLEVHAFGCGTLPGHALQGEERFAIEYHHGNGSVWFDVLSFSRPAHPIARLGRAWVQHLQRGFVVAAPAAMKRAVDAG